MTIVSPIYPIYERVVSDAVPWGWGFLTWQSDLMVRFAKETGKEITQDKKEFYAWVKEIYK